MCYVGKATKIFIFIVAVLVVTGLILGFGLFRSGIHKFHKCSGDSCHQSPMIFPNPSPVTPTATLTPNQNPSSNPNPNPPPFPSTPPTPNPGSTPTPPPHRPAPTVLLPPPPPVVVTEAPPPNFTPPSPGVAPGPVQAQLL